MSEPYRLARLRPDRLHGEDIEEVVVGLGEANAQRIAVHDLEAGDFRVVVEAALLLGLRDRVLDAGDAALDEPQVRRRGLGIHEALEGELVVGGGQLALLALERRIVGEEDPLLDAQGVRLAVVGDLRHRLERLRLQLRGPREEVVGERRLEDLLDDVVRVLIGRERRVEVGLRDEVGDAEDFRLGDRELRAMERGQRQDRRCETPHLPATFSCALVSMSMYFQKPRITGWRM
jgi:hypothetical protein